MTPEARRLQEIADALAELPRELRGVDLIPEVRRVIDARPVARTSRRPIAIAAVAVVATLAAAAAVVLVPGGTATDASEQFRAKGAGAGVDAADRWVGVQAYRIVDREGRATPVRLGDRVAAGEGLAFAYTNLGPQPFEYLMIVAVDSRGEVFWFYPAYERDGDDPLGIPIRRGYAGVELPDVVRQRPAAGRLVIYGLFTRAPLRVSDVEAQIRDTVVAGSDARLPIDGAGQHVIVTEVSP